MVIFSLYLCGVNHLQQQPVSFCVDELLFVTSVLLASAVCPYLVYPVMMFEIGPFNNCVCVCLCNSGSLEHCWVFDVFIKSFALDLFFFLNI